MKNSTSIKHLLVVLLLLISLQSVAQNLVPFAPKFDQDVKGDMLLIGNTILGINNTAYNVTSGSAAHNANLNMQYLDVDGDSSTFNSSSADLEISNSSCYKIIYAALYWGASVKGIEPVTNIKFKGPTGGYNDIVGTAIYEATTTPIVDLYAYACYADVTNIVNNLTSSIENSIRSKMQYKIQFTLQYVSKV